MNKISIIFCYAFILILQCNAEEFIYPVAKINDENIFIVHQKAVDDLSLFLWNAESKVATKELSSIYLPSHIRMLPSKTGFSFFNRGRINIKYFQKRAPKAIDILEPIDSIYSMYWIGDCQFYLVGKYMHHYKVFLCNLSETSYQLYYLTNLDSMDYIYPFKIKDSLFCISKNENQVYFITEQSWYPTLFGQSRANNFQELILESSEPLCFLYMKNKSKGYFLKCNIFNTNNDREVIFTCCSCIKKDNCWDITSLFSFKIPAKYITGDSDHRVYESVNPFLPNYKRDDEIFFVDYDRECQTFLIYVYNISSGTISQAITQKRSEFENKGFLAPFVLKNSFCCGLILPSLPQKSLRSIFRLDQETGLFNLNLPVYVF